MDIADSNYTLHIRYVYLISEPQITQYDNICTLCQRPKPARCVLLCSGLASLDFSFTREPLLTLEPIRLAIALDLSICGTVTHMFHKD